jgi:hypothetical protein
MDQSVGLEREPNPRVWRVYKRKKNKNDDVDKWDEVCMGVSAIKVVSVKEYFSSKKFLILVGSQYLWFGKHLFASAVVQYWQIVFVSIYYFLVLVFTFSTNNTKLLLQKYIILLSLYSNFIHNPITFLFFLNYST